MFSFFLLLCRESYMYMKRVCVVVLLSEAYLYEIGFSFDVKLISIYFIYSFLSPMFLFSFKSFVGFSLFLLLCISVRGVTHVYEKSLHCSGVVWLKDILMKSFFFLMRNSYIFSMFFLSLLFCFPFFYFNKPVGI